MSSVSIRPLAIPVIDSAKAVIEIEIAKTGMKIVENDYSVNGIENSRTEPETKDSPVPPYSKAQ